MVSEVLEYKDATALLEWGFQLDQTTQAQILKALKIDASSNWSSNERLSLKYNKQVIVGYKSIEIGKELISYIESKIVENKSRGNQVKVYKDSDGDGYGNTNNSMVVYEKEIPKG